MLKLQPTKDAFQDTVEVVAFMALLAANFSRRYPGFDIDVVQSAPIQETAGDKTGCRWDATLLSLSNAYPNADQGIQISLAGLNAMTEEVSKADLTPDLVAAGCDHLMNEFVSSDYFNGHPDAVRGQMGNMPYSVPVPQAL